MDREPGPSERTVDATEAVEILSRRIAELTLAFHSMTSFLAGALRGAEILDGPDSADAIEQLAKEAGESLAMLVGASEAPPNPDLLSLAKAMLAGLPSRPTLSIIDGGKDDSAG